MRPFRDIAFWPGSGCFPSLRSGIAGSSVGLSDRILADHGPAGRTAKALDELSAEQQVQTFWDQPAIAPVN